MKIVVVGAGEVGYHLAKKLSRENKDVVLIEKDSKRVATAQENLDVQVIQGSGSSPEILKRAGVERADMMIAVTNSDETNMIACLIAGANSKSTTRIARVRDAEFFLHEKLWTEDFLHVDLAINPDGEVVKTLMKLTEVPGATDVADFSEGKVRLVGLPVKPGAKIVGRKLLDLRTVIPNGQFLVAAIYRGKEVIIPRGVDAVQEGDVLLLVATESIKDEIYAALGMEKKPLRRIMVFGGSNIGKQLCLALEQKGFSPKLIEKDQETCRKLGEELKKTIILHGDPTESDLLQEENIGDVDAFFAVGNDEEENILVSLLARSLGARHIYTLIHRLAYMRLISALGVDVVVSANLSAMGKILQFIRRGKVLSVTAFRDDEAEAIEVMAMETSDLVNKPLKNLKFPKNAIIGAVVRDGKVIIPDGETKINPGDRVVIFALRSAISKVEKALMVKLEFF